MYVVYLHHSIPQHFWSVYFDYFISLLYVFAIVIISLTIIIIFIIIITI